MIVTSINDLKALDTTVHDFAYLDYAGRSGIFRWRSGDYAARIGLDGYEGMFVKANAVAANIGAWVRDGASAGGGYGWRDVGINAEWFGVIADSLGTTGSGTDNSPILASIANIMHALNIHKVTLPTGVIRFGSTVTFGASAIRISGAGMGLPTAWPNPVIPGRSSGTWVYFDHAGIGFRFQSDGTNPRFASRIEHFTTMRNHPAPTSGWSPLVQGADFSCYLHTVHFEDIGLLNPYIGFSLNQSPCSFNHIRSQPLFRFVEANEVFDVCRWNDIHLWPYWSLSQFVGAYTRTNLICFNLGRCDNPQFSNIFSIRQYIGIRIYNGTNGSTQRLKGTNVEFDVGGFGLVITSDTNGLILQLTNFVVFCSTEIAAATRGIWIDGSSHNIQIANLEISNPGAQAILVSGTGNVMGVCNYRLYNYGENTPNAAGIYTNGTNCVLTFVGAESVSSPNSNVRVTIAGSGNKVLKGSTATFS